MNTTTTEDTMINAPVRFTTRGTAIPVAMSDGLRHFLRTASNLGMTGCVEADLALADATVLGILTTGFRLTHADPTKGGWGVAAVRRDGIWNLDTVEQF